ncbi:MAG: CPXCG motif-containing cysteine-rich protein [Bacteroidetes bacterium]|nr:CPXCG motif-containing cysteine-rich protein [Bacteroidota bacterium]
MIEHPYTCPYCNEEIIACMDPTVNAQEYIEDCEVCCQPIQINYTLVDGQLIYFSAIGIEQ